ncbi:MAG: hypothetical protein ACRERD_29140 [Candidatus Binatia bacterium]
MWTRKTAWLFVLILNSTLLGACGREAGETPRGQQAVQMVKAHSPEAGKTFTVISNIEKMSQDSGRAGDPWELGDWEVGYPSQKDSIMDVLSEYFALTFSPTGNYWVRFTYKDKKGAHEALWDVNVYSKKVTVKNDVAQNLTVPPAPPAAAPTAVDPSDKPYTGAPLREENAQ